MRQEREENNTEHKLGYTVSRNKTRLGRHTTLPGVKGRNGPLFSLSFCILLYCRHHKDGRRWEVRFGPSLRSKGLLNGKASVMSGEAGVEITMHFDFCGSLIFIQGNLDGIKKNTTFLLDWKILFYRGTEPRKSPHKEK